jgi:DNA polymerase-3 subunit gamma/tau
MFSTVVGQTAITNTLKNAIKNNQLAQAFLFCGPRGVGKTTCARILAKTINCFNKTPDGEACNRCESCVSFNNGQSLNIYELDAASNNSVDDIRALIDQVRFAPQLGKYKVYIIDEVHMLSTAAFNAFLKTLEEPPAHAIFILATTEKHKILPTILSRCQKFDFNRITIQDISKHLAEIAQKENIQADPEALHIIASKADGGLRDALSMFDQLVSFNGGHSLTYQSVLENLHILDYDYYFKVGEFILSGNIPGILLLYNDILTNGFDGLQFISGIAEHLRNLLVCKDQQTIKLLEVSEAIKSKYLEQSAKIPQEVLLKAIGLCTKAEIEYKSAKNQRLLAEYTLMQLVSLMQIASSNEKKNDQSVISNNSTKGITVVAENQPVFTTLKQSATPELSASQPTKLTQTVKVQESVSMPIIEIEKGTILKNKKKIGVGISITNIIKSTTQAQNNTDLSPSVLPTNPINADKLAILWQQFANKLKEQKRISLYNTFIQNIPSIKENQLYLKVANKVLQSEVEDIKGELLSFLRQELVNYALELQIEIGENLVTTKAYTPQERFKAMVEKNPLLLSLKNKLDLDLDF